MPELKIVESEKYLEMFDDKTGECESGAFYIGPRGFFRWLPYEDLCDPSDHINEALSRLGFQVAPITKGWDYSLTSEELESVERKLWLLRHGSIDYLTLRFRTLRDLHENDWFYEDDSYGRPIDRRVHYGSFWRFLRHGRYSKDDFYEDDWHEDTIIGVILRILTVEKDDSGKGVGFAGRVK